MAKFLFKFSNAIGSLDRSPAGRVIAERAIDLYFHGAIEVLKSAAANGYLVAFFHE